MVIREQELEGAGFPDRRWRDFEVEDGAEVIRRYNGKLRGSKPDVGKFGADGDHEGRREVTWRECTTRWAGLEMALADNFEGHGHGAGNCAA